MELQSTVNGEKREPFSRRPASEVHSIGFKTQYCNSSRKIGT